jgi:hypothetical protein
MTPLRKTAEVKKERGVVVSVATSINQFITTDVDYGYFDKWLSYVNSMMYSTIELMETKAADAIENVAEKQKAFIDFFKKIGISESFSEQTLLKKISNFNVEEFLRKLNYLPDVVLKKLGELLNAIVAAAKTFLGIIDGFVTTMKAQIGVIFKKLMTAFESFISTIKTKLATIDFSKYLPKVQEKIAIIAEKLSEFIMKSVNSLSNHIVKIENMIAKVIKNPRMLNKLKVIIDAIKVAFKEAAEITSAVGKSKAVSKVVELGAKTGKGAVYLGKIVGKAAAWIDVVYKLFKTVSVAFDEKTDFEDTGLNSFWYALAGLIIAVIVITLGVLLAKAGFIVAAAVLTVSLIGLAGYEIFAGVDLLAIALAEPLKWIWDKIKAAWDTLNNFFNSADAKEARQHWLEYQQTRMFDTGKI